MGETDPATKIKLSRHLAAGYLLTNLLQAEPAVDDTVELLLGWLDRHADKHRPIDLDRFFTYTTFDVVGEAILSKSLGFLREGRDIGGNIANSLAQKTYVAVGGFAQWFHLLLSNPLVTWFGVPPSATSSTRRWAPSGTSGRTRPACPLGRSSPRPATPSPQAPTRSRAGCRRLSTT